MTLTHDRRAELLGACRLFGGLERDGLGAIAAARSRSTSRAEHVIARQGEIGTGFFVVVEGRVRVVARRRGGRGAGTRRVLRRAVGDRRRAPQRPGRRRRADALPGLASWDFERVLLEQPRVALAVLRAVAAPPPRGRRADRAGT